MWNWKPRKIKSMATILSSDWRATKTGAWSCSLKPLFLEICKADPKCPVVLRKDLTCWGLWLPDRIGADDLRCIVRGRMVLRKNCLGDMYVVCMHSEHVTSERCPDNNASSLLSKDLAPAARNVSFWHEWAQDATSMMKTMDSGRSGAELLYGMPWGRKVRAQRRLRLIYPSPKLVW